MKRAFTVFSLFLLTLAISVCAGGQQPAQAQAGMFMAHSSRPPQMASLICALVSGLSGTVGAGGTWFGQYGMPNATLAGAATVGGDGLTTNTSQGWADLPNDLLTIDPLTIALWVTLPASSSDSRIPVALGSSPAGGAIVINLAYTNCLVWAETWLGAGLWPYSFESQDLWVLRLNGTSISLSKNGGNETWSATLSAPISYGTGMSRIGAHSGGDPAMKNAAIDCVYAWSTILTDEDEQWLWSKDPYRQGNR